MEPFELSPSIAPAQSVVMAEKAAYRYDHTSGHFLPANDAAQAECRAWNDWAHATMLRLGTLPPQWGQHHSVT